MKYKNLSFPNSQRTECEGARNRGKGREGDRKRRLPGKHAAPTRPSRRRRPRPTPRGDPRLGWRPAARSASADRPRMWGRLGRVGLERTGSCRPRSRWGAAWVPSGIRGNTPSSFAPPCPDPNARGWGTLPWFRSSSAHPHLGARPPTGRETRAGCAHGKSGSRRVQPTPAPTPEAGPGCPPTPSRPGAQAAPSSAPGGALDGGPPSPGGRSLGRGQTKPSSDPGVPGASSGATRGARRSSRATGWGQGGSGSYLGTESRELPSIGDARAGEKGGKRARRTEVWREEPVPGAHGRARAGWDRCRGHAPPRPGSAASRDRRELPSPSPLRSRWLAGPELQPFALRRRSPGPGRLRLPRSFPGLSRSPAEGTLNVSLPRALPSRLLPSASGVRRVSALKLFTHFPSFALYCWQCPHSPLVAHHSLGCVARSDVIFGVFYHVIG